MRYNLVYSQLQCNTKNSEFHTLVHIIIWHKMFQYIMKKINCAGLQVMCFLIFLSGFFPPAYNIKKWFPSHQILFKDELHVWKKNTEILYTVVTFNSSITLYSWFLFWKLAKHLLLSVRQIHTIWTIGLHNMWNKRFQYICVFGKMTLFTLFTSKSIVIRLQCEGQF